MSSFSLPSWSSSPFLNIKVDQFNEGGSARHRQGVVTLLKGRAANWHRTQAQAAVVAVCHRPIAWLRYWRNVFREISRGLRGLYGGKSQPCDRHREALPPEPAGQSLRLAEAAPGHHHPAECGGPVQSHHREARLVGRQPDALDAPVGLPPALRRPREPAQPGRAVASRRRALQPPAAAAHLRPGRGAAALARRHRGGGLRAGNPRHLPGRLQHRYAAG